MTCARRPHWDYLLQGELTVTYADGTHEVINSSDLFYWPPGHTVKVGKDAEVILFSPQDEHSKVIESHVEQDGWLSWQAPATGLTIHSSRNRCATRLDPDVVHRHASVPKSAVKVACRFGR